MRAQSHAEFGSIASHIRGYSAILDNVGKSNREDEDDFSTILILNITNSVASILNCFPFLVLFLGSIHPMSGLQGFMFTLSPAANYQDDDGHTRVLGITWAVVASRRLSSYSNLVVLLPSTTV